MCPFIPSLLPRKVPQIVILEAINKTESHNQFSQPCGYGPLDRELTAYLTGLNSFPVAVICMSHCWAALIQMSCISAYLNPGGTCMTVLSGSTGQTHQLVQAAQWHSHACTTGGSGRWECASPELKSRNMPRLAGDVPESLQEVFSSQYLEPPSPLVAKLSELSLITNSYSVRCVCHSSPPMA